MLRDSIGVLINNKPNRYKLVLDVAERAREIAQKAEDSGEILVEKTVSLAIGEMAAEIEKNND